ncbi:hypothetical protein LPL18_005940 [Halomonas sp. CUBES01]|uniref:hypothetical protein n=1 Tax=Halomonas sp. CUBES01 TaxID=2897340 RepID=UPI001E425ACF|nr:hypothetical protein [Halomonas sp. CUBES01]MEC4766874.1 hypothetical protein [Halomonas sp. CUBES01]
MNIRYVLAGVVAINVLAAAPFASASETQDRFREEGRGMDLTGILQSRTDASSQRFLFGSVNTHKVTVDEPGQYRFSSNVTSGFSDDYQIAAELLNSNGEVIARSEALGQNGGLAMQEALAPGDYTLRVEGRRFGTRGKAGDGYSISVAGLNAQGQVVEDSVSDGAGIAFTGNGERGGRSVFVRQNDAVVALGAGASQDESRSSGANDDVMDAADAEPSTASSQQASAESSTKQAQPAANTFEEIVSDVKIRASGEVLTFEMAEAGRIQLTTSTYPTGYEDTYRIEVDILDEQNRVVAEGAGEGFDGDVDVTTNLESGRYRVRVSGQKFGSAHSGVNNYELRIRRLN